MNVKKEEKREVRVASRRKSCIARKGGGAVNLKVHYESV